MAGDAPAEPAKVRRIPAFVRLPRQPMLRHGLIVLVAAVACYALSVSISAFANAELASVAVYTIAIAGLAMLTGGTGQLSIGHGALMCIGAYAYAVFAEHQPHVPLVIGLLVAVGVTATAGVVVGLGAARLRGPYLAGVTLTLALAVPQLADVYFNSDQGVPVNLTPPSSVELNHWLAWICMLGALVTLLLLANLRTSRYYRSFTAVRDDEIAASLSGISVARTQILAFVLSAAAAGLAGALFAIVNLGATSGAFPLVLSILLIAGMMIGGIGRLVGAVWGGIVLVYVPIWLGHLVGNPSSSLAANLPYLVFGVLIIVIVLVAPGGIDAATRRCVAYVRRRARSA